MQDKAESGAKAPCIEEYMNILSRVGKTFSTPCQRLFTTCQSRSQNGCGAVQAGGEQSRPVPHNTRQDVAVAAERSRQRHPDIGYSTIRLVLATTGRTGMVCSGNSPVRLFRNATICLTCSSLRSLLSWVLAMTRTASSRVLTEPL